MRTAITRAVEEIRAQHGLSEKEVVAQEHLRGIEINLPNTKEYLFIPPYTPKEKVMSMVRVFLKEELRLGSEKNKKQRPLL